MKQALLFLALLAILTTCRERFEAEQVYKPSSILVVEGFINVGPGVTRIKLSRVTPLNDSGQQDPEPGAIVAIEDDTEATYALQDKGNGLYESAELGLTLGREYRLRIKTGDQVFLSDFTSPIITPPVDSISWIRSADNYVTISTSTHDSFNKTLFYKWEYEEVWEVHTAYVSSWAYENGSPRIRTTDEITDMSICWPRRQNTDLLMATSAAFINDAIIQFPLTTFHINDQRLGWRYSMIVTQRALHPNEYNFLQVMKRNSSDLGGFFDSQPSQLIGNIQCITSNEPVVGFIGSYTSQKKQLIIKHEQISDFVYVQTCPFDLLNAMITDPQFQTYLQDALPIQPIYGPFEDDAPPIIGFVLVQRTCADCRFPGTGPKPDFWVAEDEEEIE